MLKNSDFKRISSSELLAMRKRAEEEITRLVAERDRLVRAMNKPAAAGSLDDFVDNGEALASVKAQLSQQRLELNELDRQISSRDDIDVQIADDKAGYGQIL